MGWRSTKKQRKRDPESSSRGRGEDAMSEGELGIEKKLNRTWLPRLNACIKKSCCSIARFGQDMDSGRTCTTAALLQQNAPSSLRQYADIHVVSQRTVTPSRFHTSCTGRGQHTRMRVFPLRMHLSTSCKKATRLHYCDLDPSFFMRVGLMKYGLGHRCEGAGPTD